MSYHNPTDEERAAKFWAKVDKSSGGCWLWTGTCRKRYAQFRVKQGKMGQASAFAWFLKYGKFPEKDLCHTCDNTRCVNWDHLFEGTESENALDAVKKERMVKFKQSVVKEIRREFATGEYSMRELGRKYNMSQTHVSRLVNNKRRKLTINEVVHFAQI